MESVNPNQPESQEQSTAIEDDIATPENYELSEQVCKLFGLKLREVRLSSGLSQEKLAEMAGLDRTYINSTENGKRNLSLINIFRIAEALGVQAKDLLDVEF